MNQKEVTVIGRLRIGDRFVFLGSKKIVVFQIEKFKRATTKDIAVITKSPDCKSFLKFFFRRSCSVYKEVMFIRHTKLHPYDNCFLQDLQRGDVFYKKDTKVPYILLENTKREITLCRQDDKTMAKIYMRIRYVK